MHMKMRNLKKFTHSMITHFQNSDYFIYSIKAKIHKD